MKFNEDFYKQLFKDIDNVLSKKHFMTDQCYDISEDGKEEIVTEIKKHYPNIGEVSFIQVMNTKKLVRFSRVEFYEKPVEEILADKKLQKKQKSNKEVLKDKIKKSKDFSLAEKQKLLYLDSQDKITIVMSILCFAAICLFGILGLFN